MALGWRRSWCGLWLAGAIGWAWLLPAHALAQAPALRVSPISVTMLAGQMSSALSVTDEGTDPTTLQIRPFVWRQTDAGDELTPADTLVVSPPIIQIGPGETQTFRLVLAGAPDGGETEYRLLIDQLPPPAAAGVVHVSLRLSVPVFVAAADGTPAQIQWQVTRDGGAEALVARNAGGAHARIMDPRLTLADGQVVPLAAAPTPYILPGAEKSWAMAANVPAGSALLLSARTDSGPVSQPLVAP